MVILAAPGTPVKLSLSWEIGHFTPWPHGRRNLPWDLFSLMDKQFQWAGELMPQGMSREGGVCCISFLAVTANHREKEGTQGLHLPGQLNAEVCRMPSISLHMLSASTACRHGMSVCQLCPQLLTKASHGRPWSSVTWGF